MIKFNNDNYDDMFNLAVSSSTPNQNANSSGDDKRISLRLDQTGEDRVSGTTVLRLLPWTDKQSELKLFPMRYYLHYNLVDKGGSKKPFRCSKKVTIVKEKTGYTYKLEGRCPICEESEALQSSGQDDKSYRIRSKVYFVYGAIDLTESTAKIGYFVANEKLNSEIQGLAQKAYKNDGVNIFSPKDGNKIEIYRYKNDKYINFETRLLEQKPLSEKTLAKCAKDCPDITELHKTYTYKELCDLLKIKPRKDYSARVSVGEEDTNSSEDNQEGTTSNNVVDMNAKKEDIELDDDLDMDIIDDLDKELERKVGN